jgi:hypothetical protein
MWGIIGFNGYEGDSADSSATINMPQTGEHWNWTWYVEPTFGYSSIGHCVGCDVFAIGREGPILDVITGMPTGEFHGAHSDGGWYWVYDEDLELFGIHCTFRGEGNELLLYPISEYRNIEFEPEYIRNNIKYVRRIDSTNLNAPWSHGLAIAVGNEIITDFIYQRGRGRTLNTAGLISVADENGKHGVIHVDVNATSPFEANVVIPFIFDNLLIIDNWTAFAKYNGNYGIISLNGNVPDQRHTGSPPNAVLLKHGDRVGENHTLENLLGGNKVAIVDSDGNAFNKLHFDRVEYVDNGIYGSYYLGHFADTGMVYKMRPSTWWDEERKMWYEKYFVISSKMNVPIRVQEFNGRANLANSEWAYISLENQIDLIKTAADTLWAMNKDVNALMPFEVSYNPAWEPHVQTAALFNEKNAVEIESISIIDASWQDVVIVARFDDNISRAIWFNFRYMEDESARLYYVILI